MVARVIACLCVCVGVHVSISVAIHVLMLCRDEFREWTESEKAEKIVRVMDGLEGEVAACCFCFVCDE